jgi:hypothetical protein
MAFDSTIRIRQINQSELSGFVIGAIPSVASQISGNIIPSGSGVYNLGSLTNYYKNVYSNGITLPSGSGIQIGSSFLTAYSSGGAGVVQIDGYKITSSGNFISIQGPQGIQGPSGATGVTGPTGTSITGASYNSGTYNLSLYFSNGYVTGFYIPPITGPTGVSVTGFFQSGSYIYPQFDRFQGTGLPIQLIAGPVGPPGSINLNFYSGNNSHSFSQANFPNGVVIDPYYYTGYYPDISLMRGMAYTFDSSGLATHIITEQDTGIFGLLFSGQTIPFSVGDPINYYEGINNGTGYWRPVFFDKNQATGFFNSISNPSVFNSIDLTNNEVYYDFILNNLYRTKISFSTQFTAKNNYKYGFAVYTIGGDTTNDYLMTGSSITGYAVVCGNVYVSSGVGPAGPSGAQGPQGDQGIVGPQGVTGPPGESVQGVSVVSLNYENPGNINPQIQFNLSDGSQTTWVPLPTGGPSGVAGPQGPIGSLTNYFRGEYSNSNTYIQNDTISSSGSSYINTGSTIIGTPPPTSPWQMLAQKGDKGDIGATGATGYADKYSSNFYVVSGFPTGADTYANGITGITVTGLSLSGINAKFTTGHRVSFRNTGLVGYSYTPYQQIIVSTNTYTGSYFYASVNSYNSQNGTISFSVLSGLSNIAGILNTTIDASNNILWYNYGNATINLGANILSGAKGDQGIQGPKGDPGTPQALRNTSYILNYNLEGGDSIVLPTSLYDVFSILITGVQTYGNTSAGINLDWANFQTGQSVILKIRNSGVIYGNAAEGKLFTFSGAAYNNIKWPAGTYSCPDKGQAYIYTLLRFPDETGSTSCYGTYSNPYY